MRKKIIYLPIKYNVTLKAVDDKGVVRAVIKGKNVVCRSGLVLLANLFRDYNDGALDWGTGLTYIALGTGATAPLNTDIILTTEVAREDIITKSLTQNAIGFSTFFLKANCSFFIKEVGAFGHSTATTTPGTGELFMHSLLSYDNSAGLYNVTVDIEVSLGVW